MILMPCCDNDRASYAHMSVAQCTEQWKLDGDPSAECMDPGDHHPYQRRVELERGKWTYVILSHHDVWVDATSSFTDAMRAARRYLGRPARVRKGLAYGILFEREDGLTATIIPTPRHR